MATYCLSVDRYRRYPYSFRWPAEWVGKDTEGIDPMKQNFMAAVLVFSAAGLVGCAGLQQQLATVQQPAQQVPQNAKADTSKAQAQAPTQESQDDSFIADLIKTAKDTIGSEAKSAVQSTIRSAGSAIRN